MDFRYSYKKFLLFGLGAILILSLGLNLYLNYFTKQRFASSTNVSIISQLLHLEVAWNENVFEEELQALSIFSKDEIALPAAEFAPPTIPRESLRHKVDRVGVIIKSDDFLASPNNEPSRVEVWPSARLIPGDSALEITLSLREEVLTSPAVSGDVLSAEVNAVLMAYLSQIVEGSNYEDKLASFRDQYLSGGRPVSVLIVRAR